MRGLAQLLSSALMALLFPERINRHKDTLYLLCFKEAKFWLLISNYSVSVEWIGTRGEFPRQLQEYLVRGDKGILEELIKDLSRVGRVRWIRV